MSADRFSSRILSVLGLDVPLAVSKINHCAICIRHRADATIRGFTRMPIIQLHTYTLALPDPRPRDRFFTPLVFAVGKRGLATRDYSILTIS